MFRQEILAHTLICFRLSAYYPSIVAGEKAYRDLSGKGKKAVFWWTPASFVLGLGF